jgi:hypothetical protein
MCFFTVTLFVTCRGGCVTLLCVADTLLWAANINGIAAPTTAIASNVLFMGFFLPTSSIAELEP